jgi:hypothetical protein
VASRRRRRYRWPKPVREVLAPLGALAFALVVIHGLYLLLPDLPRILQ